MTPLFDSLLHPATKPEALQKKMKAAGFKWACAVGMAHERNYDHESFIKAVRRPGLIPIAGIDPRKSKLALEKELDTVKKLGFKGIKIHPRNAGIDWTYPTLPTLLKGAHARGLVTMLCTYMHKPLAVGAGEDPFYTLVRLLKAAPKAKVVLLHGGDVRVMHYAEFVRANPNLILDLSFTLMKYRGSSVDLDLAFLFKNFDRRICIGTDYPEYDHKAVAKRFAQLSRGLSQARAHEFFADIHDLERIDAGRVAEFVVDQQHALRPRVARTAAHALKSAVDEVRASFESRERTGVSQS
jgi:predicted TIM-barrel fold metal-dependent hydrolase